jgi:uncharacterized membrane protein YeiH
LSIFEIVDILGVFVGALTGALVGRRLKYDIMGLWFLALFSGLGGGIIRDVMIDSGPPLALVEPPYLPIVALGVAVATQIRQETTRAKRTITVLDAFALADFAVAGSLRALSVGLDPVPVILLGVITAIGGGILRDMMIGQTPTVFRRSELYGLAALGVCILVVLFHEIGIGQEVTVISGIVFGLFLRLGSIRWGWMSWQPQ